ncbi:MAG TPA: phytanoyl-CoA dioxygenase family protein [Acidimicrobiales bacterium]|nr:phytanoyl-CoA dioxygenase family protein [Acidimicrobiales bacterium]
MLIGEWEGTADLNEVYRDVVKNELQENIAELDAYGFTVVPPEKVAPPEFQARLVRALLDAHERTTGVHIEDPADAVNGTDAIVSTHWNLLLEDRVFEEALLNPAVYTLARYLCGRSVVLSDLLGMLKNQDPRPTHTLHTDQHGTPPPLPPYAQVCNVTWALTEYTAENGPVAIVPGSHRFGRVPMAYEAKFLAENAPVKAIPVEAPAGSLIVWHGNTWHGSFPRKSPGLRLNLIFLFARSYMKTIRDFRRDTPQELLDRNPPEFADLLGVNHPYPFDGDTFPDADKVKRFVRSGENPWA